MHPDWEQESKRLKEIVQFISSLLKKKFEEKDYLINEQAEINRSMWEDSGTIQDLESISDFMQHIGMLKQNMAWSKLTAKDIVRLDKQLSSPYFGRIDFKEGSEKPDKIYIGIHTLTNDETSEILIYDWRAPICSMFYDYETGPASYKCPAGIISGEITLKRQYRVEGGKLVYMFDSNVAINDDILQQILASNTSTKMKSIVSTIQKEQNQAIREESTRLLAIQGAAGSGKTSVALHRASYLLYRHKKHIKSENLVILSSTDVLGDYISDVLPELGEDEIKGVTFKKILSQHLKLNGYKIQSHPNLLEHILTTPDKDYRQKVMSTVSFKSSSSFFEVLKRFMDYALTLFHFEDIYFKNHLIASKEDLKRLFFHDFEKMPPLARLKRIENRISELVKPHKKLHQQKKAETIENEEGHVTRKEAKALSHLYLKQETMPYYESLQRMLSVSAISLYTRLFEDDAVWEACLKDIPLQNGEFIRQYTLEALHNRFVGFEDGGPLLYLSLYLGEIESESSVKHLMVDEAQDYSLIQLLALSKLYPSAGITFLGDISQNISPYASAGNLESTAAAISPGDYTFIRLNKSYRSTVEISTFSSFFLQAEKGESFGRHGDKPSINLVKTEESLGYTIYSAIMKHLEKGYKSVAVITRTLQDARKLHDALKEHSKSLSKPIRLMHEDYEYAVEGVMVIPSYLSKGLEFDSTIVVVNSSSDYGSEYEKGLLYTVLSRALHQLDIYCHSEALPQVFSHIDPVSYTILQEQIEQ